MHGIVTARTQLSKVKKILPKILMILGVLVGIGLLVYFGLGFRSALRCRDIDRCICAGERTCECFDVNSFGEALEPIQCRNRMIPNRNTVNNCNEAIECWCIRGNEECNCDYLVANFRTRIYCPNTQFR